MIDNISYRVIDADVIERDAGLDHALTLPAYSTPN